MTARAGLSGQRSDEIIAGLASGLLVVGVRWARTARLNPAGRHVLGMEGAWSWTAWRT